MINKAEGLQKIKELVTRFSEQLPAYKKSDYNETQTRRDFIDPFFKALGWDIDNEQGAAESYREVIHEDKVKVGKATKAPDYSFRLGGGQRLFFVEAKKPSVLIKDDIQPAYQVRRYGWSAKLSVSVITDFEEFAIYDCTKKPNPTDKTSVARVKYITFTDYENEWDFLWSTFSKEAVLKGSFDKFIGGNANKKGTATVDKAFLTSLDEWRTLLAETISKENKQLDEDELNFVVQQTLDRIIFLRICEDRSIEPYGSLQVCLKTGEAYQNLLTEFKQADDKYNSGLFDFKKDTLSKQLAINNKTLKTIINQLYYPECPYEFSVLSVEILGSAYEQFLGKTITINNRGKAVIELKPEVRKAGGVYYTPQYIVDYIVQNTIGKLVENKNPTEVAAIKIVDPACGSGSFLLGAYQFLLNWHIDYYKKNTNKKNPVTPEGNLTTTEKKKILLNNIYGVDIDINAVEVTKLSLLLKCMEGETQASIAHQMTMFKERVLPTLENNIKSGNSLIDTDYYDNQLDFGEERKIKPFSWQKAFPYVFTTTPNRKLFLDFVEMSKQSKEQYIQFAKLMETTSMFIHLCKENNFSNDTIRKMNEEHKTNLIFSDKNIETWYSLHINPLQQIDINKVELLLNYYSDAVITNERQFVQYILRFTKENYDKDNDTFWLHLLLNNGNILDDIAANNKIAKKTVYNEANLFFLEELKDNFDIYLERYASVNNKNESGFDVVIGNPPYVKVSDKNIFEYFNTHYFHQDYQQDLYLLFLEKYNHLLLNGGKIGVIIPNTWLQSIKYKNVRKYLVRNYYWNKILNFKNRVFDAIVDTHVIIFEKNVVEKNINFCVEMYTENEFELLQIIDQNDLPFEGEVINIVSSKKEKHLFIKIKEASNLLGSLAFSTVGVKPFQVGKGNPKQTREIVNKKPFVVEKDDKPNGKNWMPLMRGNLMNRYVSFWENNSWIEYGPWLAEPRTSETFKAEEKIIIRQTGDSIIATIIGKDIICRNNLHIVISNEINHHFLLGIINSKLTNFYYNQINPEKGEALAEVKKNHVEQLPIPEVYSKESYNQVIAYVNQLLQLNKDLHTANLETKKDQIKQKIAYNEDKINAMVYALYDLTPDEIKIIEGN